MAGSAKRFSWVLVLVAMLGSVLTACNSPSLVNHSPPDLAVDLAPFEQAGCPSDEYGFRHCAAESPLAALGCDEIRQVDLLGGLDPAYPIAQCVFRPQAHPEEQDYFFQLGCRGAVSVRYVIWREGQFELIATEDELRAVYAPIESAQEALSYALAVRGDHSARYGLTYQPESYAYLAKEIQDTHVEQQPDGYLVHLFYYTPPCGCSYHETEAVGVLVTEQGRFQEVRREVVYRDLAEMCID